MTNRSRAREVALQLLFQRDHNAVVDRTGVERFVHDRLADPALRSFCLALYDGAVNHAEEIDQRLTQAAENWRLPRMAGVDRNVLRLGAFELLFSTETPPGVALNEAIELAAASAPPIPRVSSMASWIRFAGVFRLPWNRSLAKEIDKCFAPFSAKSNKG
jgi:transcription antitermination factor NusB